MSALTEEYYIKPTLQYIMNWHLDDWHQGRFLKYMQEAYYHGIEDDMLDMDSKTVENYIDEYKDWHREVNTHPEDLYMTRGS